MNALIRILAWASSTFFSLLVLRAIYALFLMQHVIIPLPIPKQPASPVVDNSQLVCMAQNIYWEAQGENAQGKAMVATVVMERLKSPHFPKTICEIVHAMNEDHVCAFSWYCEHRNHDIDFDNPIQRDQWMQSYAIANLVMHGKFTPPIDMDGVTNYHANYVKPYWSKDKNFKLVVKVDHHWFYRWKKAFFPKYVAMN